MRSVSLFLVAWFFCLPLKAGNSYRGQMKRLRQELLGLETRIKGYQSEEASLQGQHRKAVRDLRGLEESLRRNEERVQSLQYELSHYERAHRQANMEKDKFQLQGKVIGIRDLLTEARAELRVVETEVMKLRDLASLIVSEIQTVRVEISSLAAMARASDLQTDQINRKLKGL